jgi:hypothetical protein
MEPEKTDLMNLNMPPDEYNQKHFSFPLIAGILLIVAGVASIFGWILFMNTDESLLVDLLKQLQEVDPSYTMENVKNFISVCSLIGIVVSIFPILSGVISVKKKMWGVALTGSIIGFFTIIPFFILIFLPIISMILLIISRKEFKKSSS